MSLEGRFEEAVIAYLFIVNLLPIVIILLMWYECGKVAVLLNDWMDFEVCFEATRDDALCCLHTRKLAIFVYCMTHSLVFLIIIVQTVSRA